MSGYIEIVETSVFTRQARKLLDGDSYRYLQLELADRSEKGRVIPGSGGLRKLRWALSGRGKRGGVRVIYYWVERRDVILMLFIYSKADRNDLTADQVKVLRRVVQEELA